MKDLVYLFTGFIVFFLVNFAADDDVCRCTLSAVSNSKIFMIQVVKDFFRHKGQVQVGDEPKAGVS